MQSDKPASMDDPLPPPDAVSGGVNVTVPEKEHVAALPVMVVVVGVAPPVAVPMEIVPDTDADLRPLRAHARSSFEGF